MKKRKSEPATDQIRSLFSEEQYCTKCGKPFDPRSKERLTEHLTGVEGHQLCPECAHNEAVRRLPKGSQ
jgi:hypothetical protein